MRALDSRLERLDDIERRLICIPSGLTIGEIARPYSKNLSTIYRDLLLLHSLGAGLRREKRRWILDRRRPMHHIRLTDDEVMALYLASRLLVHYSDERNTHVSSALEKLADAVSLRSPRAARHLALAAEEVRTRPPHPEYVAVLEVLTRAWFEGRKVLLRYRSYTKGETIERAFAPYTFEAIGVGFACYVIGHDEPPSRPRTPHSVRWPAGC